MITALRRHLLFFPPTSSLHSGRSLNSLSNHHAKEGAAGRRLRNWRPVPSHLQAALRPDETHLLVSPEGECQPGHPHWAGKVWMGSWAAARRTPVLIHCQPTGTHPVPL